MPFVFLGSRFGFHDVFISAGNDTVLPKSFVTYLASVAVRHSGFLLNGSMFSTVAMIQAEKQEAPEIHL